MSPATMVVFLLGFLLIAPKFYYLVMLRTYLKMDPKMLCVAGKARKPFKEADPGTYRDVALASLTCLLRVVSPCYR